VRAVVIGCSIEIYIMEVSEFQCNYIGLCNYKKNIGLYNSVLQWLSLHAERRQDQLIQIGI